MLNDPTRQRALLELLGYTMLRLNGKATTEANRGLEDAVRGRYYRQSAIEIKDPTCRAEYHTGFNLGRWLKFDKKPSLSDLVQHAEAQKLYDEFVLAPACG